VTGALDFSSPGLAADAQGFHPLARSSMERRFRDAGATFEERDGWLVPVSVPGEAESIAVVGLADLSHLGKLEVRTAVTAATPAAADATVYRISPRRTLVLCPTARTASLHDALAAEHELVLDVTAQHGILVLAGPEAGTVLRRITHLHHFPSGGEVAHITAHVLAPQSTGPDGPGPYMIVFPQEYGHYLYEAALDRAGALGGGPVGVDVLEATA
jgi:glycine cleavage system aminomethyltransferase T